MTSRRLVVTGASSGIGLALVRKLSDAGHRVMVIARRRCSVESNLVTSVSCDLSSVDAINTMLLSRKHENLDGIILCHGYGDFGALEQFSADRIEALVNTNLVSCLLLLRWALPKMKSAKNGNVVLLGSEAALRGARQGSVYCATKFALRGLAQSLREECSTSGVRVSIINPGMVDTPFFEDLAFTPGEDGDNALRAEDVASVMMNVLNAPVNQVMDEINLSPLKHVVRHKKS